MKKIIIVSAFAILGGFGNQCFAQSNNNAFGNNQAEVEPGVFAIYSGDLDQSGAIDGADYSIVENDLTLYLFAGLYTSDLNGDGNVDGADYSFIENQMPVYIFLARP